MNMFRKFILAVAVLTLLAAGCAPQPAEPTPAPGEETPFETPTKENMPENIKLQSDLPRQEPSASAYEDMKLLPASNTAFALDLYQQLRLQDGNLFFSPYSISVALAMTHAGARGETETQMASTLHFDLAQDRLHPAFNALNTALTKPSEEEAEPGFTLNIANALWAQEGFAFLPEFLDTLALNYGAGMQAVDYANPEAARQTINQWVEDQTEEKIKDLIPQGSIDEMTRLVLTNAIYFKAAWKHPFDENETSDQSFHLLDGSEVKVPMMHRTESFEYFKGEDFEVVELFYEGNKFEMLIIMPDEDAFSEFEQSLDAATLQSILEMFPTERIAPQVDLTMPKFKVESSFGLADTLASMGMPDAFDVVKADLSGMTGKTDLYITDVVHKAFVDVNEEGTEAAAATGVVVGLKSMPLEEPVKVVIDHPFLFLIRDVETGTVLFLGRVVEP